MAERERRDELEGTQREETERRRARREETKKSLKRRRRRRRVEVWMCAVEDGTWHEPIRLPQNWPLMRLEMAISNRTRVEG